MDGFYRPKLRASLFLWLALNLFICNYNLKQISFAWNAYLDRNCLTEHSSWYLTSREGLQDQH